jgi:hypothetical protein
MNTILVLAMMAATACWASARAASPADIAFQQLRSLSGDWEGADEGGTTVHTTFRAVSGDTAVLETLKHGEMEEMLTLYSVDGESIALQHYCPTNNQPRMGATPATGKVKQLVFEFEGAGNLPDSDTGHQHKLIIEFIDATHITERWTWRAKGKDTPMVFHLTRKNDSQRPTKK